MHDQQKEERERTVSLNEQKTQIVERNRSLLRQASLNKFRQGGGIQPQNQINVTKPIITQNSETSKSQTTLNLAHMHQPTNPIKIYPELDILLPRLSAQENEWWIETK